MIGSSGGCTVLLVLAQGLLMSLLVGERSMDPPVGVRTEQEAQVASRELISP